MLQELIRQSVRNGNTINSICCAFSGATHLCRNREFLNEVWIESFGPVPAYMEAVTVQTIDEETEIRRKLSYLQVGNTAQGNPMYKLWDGSYYELKRSPDSDKNILSSPISSVGGPGFVMVR